MLRATIIGTVTCMEYGVDLGSIVTTITNLNAFALNLHHKT
jgi:hypothetical protein